MNSFQPGFQPGFQAITIVVDSFQPGFQPGFQAITVPVPAVVVQPLWGLPIGAARVVGPSRRILIIPPALRDHRREDEWLLDLLTDDEYRRIA